MKITKRIDLIFPEFANEKDADIAVQHMQDIYSNVEFRKVENTFDNIREWARERGIYAKGNPHTQTVKLMEEVGELAKAVLEQDDREIIDGIGDCVVVLTNLAVLCGFDIQMCIESAYNEIYNRKGKMENGTFVKEHERCKSDKDKTCSLENLHGDKLNMELHPIHVLADTPGDEPSRVELSCDAEERSCDSDDVEEQ